ncbi:cytochrome P450 18a1 [Caerostris darwini]|uniref:Cytochrome P450 18a1 n=1 Tax=Caerostris darwini TaxID=1538125 RepID=A0AAV4VQY2_9ARAC|nr:cytochrome P450 18a1 [Caerostris darwini]
MELENNETYFDFKNTSTVSVGLLFVAISFVILKVFQEIVYWYKIGRKLPPGPIGLPIVGYLPFLGKEPHKKFWNMKAKFGDIFGVYMGRKFTVILNEYNVMKEVLSHSAALDRASEVLNYLDPGGLMIENGEKWMEQRKFCLSAARDLGLGKRHWEDLIMTETSNFIEKLHDLKGEPSDISHELASSLISNIISLLIGRRLKNEESDKLQLLMDYIKIALVYTGPTLPTTAVPVLRKICESLKIAGYDKAVRVITQFASFIREEIADHKTSPDFQDTNDFINSYLKKISSLSEAKNTNHYFSENMLAGNLNALFLGGSDTIFSSLIWLFRLMCKHKNIQENVHTELMEALGEDDTASYDERHKIPYTFAVLMEAQRISSIVPLSTTRRASQAIHINGYVIPKGSDICANLWGLHNDPAYWNKPEEFRPERFLTDDGAKLLKHPPSYTPFSIGRRNCPGETIAWMAILFYFSEILRKFEICIPPGVEPEFNVINGLVSRLSPQPLCFKERQN